MKTTLVLAVATVVTALSVGIASAQPLGVEEKAERASKSSKARIERGRYLVQVMDCMGCHATGAFVGKTKPETWLAGSQEGFEFPGFGVVFPPNLTPHKTGLKDWSEEQIIAALRTGLRPDGRVLAPIMPWPAYSRLTDDDARAIAAFLKVTPAVDHKVPGPTPAESVGVPYLTLKIPSGRP